MSINVLPYLHSTQTLLIKAQYTDKVSHTAVNYTMWSINNHGTLHCTVTLPDLDQNFDFHCPVFVHYYGDLKLGLMIKAKVKCFRPRLRLKFLASRPRPMLWDQRENSAALCWEFLLLVDWLWHCPRNLRYIAQTWIWQHLASHHVQCSTLYNHAAKHFNTTTKTRFINNENAQ